MTRTPGAPLSAGTARQITFFNLFTKSGSVIEDLAQSCEQSASIERDVSLRLPNTVIDFFPISC